MKSNFGKMGWWIIIFTLLIYLFSCAVPDTLNVLVQPFAEKYAPAVQSPEQILIFAAIGGFVSIPLSLVAGQIISKIGVKIPAIIMIIGLAVLWVLYGVAPSMGSFAVVATLIVALSDSANLVITQQLMNNWFPKKKGIALGWATMGMPLDSAITVLIFQALLTTKGFMAPFIFMGIVFVALAVIMALFVKSLPEQAGCYPDNEPISEEERKANLEFFANYKTGFPTSVMFRTKAFWLLVISFGFMFLGLVGATSQMIPRMGAVGVDQPQAVLALTIASLIGIPGSIIWGIVDQKIGTKKTTVIFALLWAIMMFVGAIGAGVVSVPITYISVIMFAALLGGLGNLMPSMCISVFGRFDFAQANKLLVPFVVGIRTLAFILIPVVSGIVGGNMQIGYTIVFIVFGILSLIALFAAMALPKDCIGRKSAEEE